MGMLDQLSAKVQSLFEEDVVDIDSVMAEMRPARLSKFLPYMSYDRTKGLFVNTTSYGFIIEVAPLPGVSQQGYDSLVGLLSYNVPDDIHVQILNMRTPRIGGSLMNVMNERNVADPILRDLTRSRVRFLAEGTRSSLSQNFKFHAREGRVYFSVSLEGSDDPEAERILEDYKISMLTTLKQVFGYAVELHEAELVALVREIVNPSDQVAVEAFEYDAEAPLNTQMVNPDTTVSVHRKGLGFSVVRDADAFLGEKSGEDDWEESTRQIQCFEVRNFPQQVRFGDAVRVLGDFFKPGFAHASPLMMCLNIHYPKAEIAKTGAEQTAMRAMSVANGPGGKLSIVTRKKAEDWELAQNAIVEGARPVNVSYFVAVSSSTGQEHGAERATRNVFQNARYELRRCDQVHLQSYLAMLPMMGGSPLGKDLTALKRPKLRISDMLTSVAPIFGGFQGTRTPKMLFLGRLGDLWYWSIYDSDGNFNCVVAAPSGGGKSFLIQDMALGHLCMGGHVVFIDDGYSARNLCRVLKGRHYEFSAKTLFCINVFDMIDVELAASDDEYYSEQMEMCRGVFAQMCLGDDKLTREESGIIMSVVTTVWNKLGRNGGSNAVHEELMALQKVASEKKQHALVELLSGMINAMTPYVGDGVYARLFNGKNSLDISNPLTVFELSPLEHRRELRSIIVSALLALVDRKVTSDRRRKDMIILDEAWKLLHSEVFVETLSGWARRLRKYGAALVVATQNVSDFEQSDDTRSIFENSYWKVILKSEDGGKSQNIDPYKGNSFAQKCAMDLKVVRGEYSEALVLCQGWNAVGRLVVEPAAQLLYSSTADEVAMIESLVEGQGMGVMEAIHEIISQREGMRHAAE